MSTAEEIGARLPVAAASGIAGGLASENLPAKLQIHLPVSIELT
jgi:hypothetical protein